MAFLAWHQWVVLILAACFLLLVWIDYRTKRRKRLSSETTQAPRPASRDPGAESLQ